MKICEPDGKLFVVFYRKNWGGGESTRSMKNIFEAMSLICHILAGRGGIKPGSPLKEVNWGGGYKYFNDEQL